MAWLAGMFAGSGRAVRVYFDGAEAHVEHRSAEVEVIYPGGAGAQRADQAILAALRDRSWGQSPGPVPVVVTRDLRLARRARKRGATVLDPAKFLADCDAGLIP